MLVGLCQGGWSETSKKQLVSAACSYSFYINLFEQIGIHTNKKFYYL